MRNRTPWRGVRRAGRISVIVLLAGAMLAPVETATTSSTTTTWGAVVFREWYDLANDPGQMRNLLGDANVANDADTSVTAKQLAAYRVCRGATCR